MMEEGTGFSAEGTVVLDNTLNGNLEIIGAHLHTGKSNVNGPANIIFCGGAPLPGVLGINGECNDLFDQRMDGNMNMAGWEALTSKGAWSDGANKDTDVAGSNSLEDGSATTYNEFMTALHECDEYECNVYFNIHTNYSFAENPGYGLARGQLLPKDCPESKPDGSKCFGGTITTEHTNEVDGLTNKLPVNAGEVTDLLITYMGGHNQMDPTNGMLMTKPADDSAATTYSGLTAVAVFAAAFVTWLH